MDVTNSYSEQRRQLIFGRTMSVINESYEEGGESSRYNQSRSITNSATHLCTELVELEDDIAEEEGISLP